jgi:hypothetical protein
MQAAPLPLSEGIAAGFPIGGVELPLNAIPTKFGTDDDKIRDGVVLLTGVMLLTGDTSPRTPVPADIPFRTPLAQPTKVPRHLDAGADIIRVGVMLLGGVMSLDGEVALRKAKVEGDELPSLPSNSPRSTVTAEETVTGVTSPFPELGIATDIVGFNPVEDESFKGAATCRGLLAIAGDAEPVGCVLEVVADAVHWGMPVESCADNALRTSDKAESMVDTLADLTGTCRCCTSS